MEMYINLLESNTRCITIKHKTLTLDWPIVSYGKLVPDGYDPAEFVQDVNKYWVSLGKEAQDKIWVLYQEIRRVLNEVLNLDRMVQQLNALVQKMSVFYPPENCLEFMSYKSNVLTPPDLKTAYVEDDIQAITYLKSEYMDLLGFTLPLRALAPVFAVLMDKVKSQVGAQYKEMLALRLLRKTDFENHPAFGRLEGYVTSYTSGTEIPMSALLKGLGSAILPEWVMSMVLVRRIAICPLIHRTQANTTLTAVAPVNIISNVYSFINSKTESFDKIFNGKISDKFPETGVSDEDNSSNAENIKIKEELSEGAIRPYVIYYRDYHEVAGRIQPDLDPVKLETCIERIRLLSTYQPQRFQKTFAQYVCSCARSAQGIFASPQAIESLELPELLNALGVSQAVLWEWGFPDLAALLTATPVYRPSGILPPLGKRSQITKDQTEQLNKLYPFAPPVRSKRAGTNNVAVEAISLLVSDIDQCGWSLHAPTPLIELCTMQSSQYGFVTPLDIRVQMADFIIRLNQHKYQ